ncbi:MAG: lysophospholipid acyltransferase family protein [Chloroflexia bacterium]
MRATTARQGRKPIIFAGVKQSFEPATGRDDSTRAARSGWRIRLTRLTVCALFRLFFRVRVEGLENLPGTPAIICPNHLGWADPFLVLLFFPIEPRIRVLGLHPRGVSRFRARVVDTLGLVVALNRARPREALRLSEGALKSGGSLLVFPEGTAVGGREGELLPLQHGAAHLSVAGGAPLIPVGLTGTKELWLRRTLTIRIGKPLDPAEFEGDPRRRVRAMTTQLGADIQALLPGDQERPRVRPLRRWLTGLFY